MLKGILPSCTFCHSLTYLPTNSVVVLPNDMYLASTSLEAWIISLLKMFLSVHFIDAVLPKSIWILLINFNGSVLVHLLDAQRDLLNMG